MYLYPLYVRPGTGIGRRGDVQRAPSAHMRHLYRAGRDFLQDAVYEQVSMRYFRKPSRLPKAGPVYCCQSDGMVGLGCGARSYTSELHYSSRFAVESAAVQAILDEWIQQTRDEFLAARWGCRLTVDDRVRRCLIQSLLTLPGLDIAEFSSFFSGTAETVISILKPLVEEGFVENCGSIFRLTALGLEFSDAIGPALYPPRNLARLESFSPW